MKRSPAWSTGMRPLALTLARNSGVRVSPFMMSYSRRSRRTPAIAAVSRILKQLPDAAYSWSTRRSVIGTPCGGNFKPQAEFLSIRESVGYEKLARLTREALRRGGEPTVVGDGGVVAANIG